MSSRVVLFQVLFSLEAGAWRLLCFILYLLLHLPPPPLPVLPKAQATLPVNIEGFPKVHGELPGNEMLLSQVGSTLPALMEFPGFQVESDW